MGEGEACSAQPGPRDIFFVPLSNSVGKAMEIVKNRVLNGM